ESGGMFVSGIVVLLLRNFSAELRHGQLDAVSRRASVISKPSVRRSKDAIPAPRQGWHVRESQPLDASASSPSQQLPREQQPEPSCPERPDDGGYRIQSGGAERAFFEQAAGLVVEAGIRRQSAD